MSPPEVSRLDSLEPVDAIEPDQSASDGIVFGAPAIGQEEIDEVVDTLRSGWLGTGPKTRQFELQFAEYVGGCHAVGTNSGTAALHLALTALELGPGDEVITTPLTFAATANVIEHVGARPVFVDVREHDGNIDPHEVLAAVTERTRAILPVHYAGAVADVGKLRSLLPTMPIVVDAAHAIESRYPDGSASAAHGGTATAYSFYVTKNLVTGEGGMLVTDSAEIADDSRIRGLHGLDRDAWRRYASGGAGSYSLKVPGFKYNMTDIQASIGIHQLRRIERYHARRTEVWSYYNRAFLNCPGISLLPVALAPDEAGRHARHLYTLLVDWLELGTDRDEFTQCLRESGIGSGWHFPPLHLEEWYAQKYGYEPGLFPVAEQIADRTISIPLSARLRDSEVERIVGTVTTVARGLWRRRWGKRRFVSRIGRWARTEPDPQVMP